MIYSFKQSLRFALTNLINKMQIFLIKKDFHTDLAESIVIICWRILGVSEIDWTMLCEKRLVKRGKCQPFLLKRKQKFTFMRRSKKNEWITALWSFCFVQLHLLWTIIFIFTITGWVLARSLANFYRQYADRHMNLTFVRRVSEREWAIRQFVIVKKNWYQFLMRLSCYWQWIAS